MKEQKTYYFIGIGGIGMSALARYLVKQGHSVFGYDRTPSDITKQLEAEGITVIFDEQKEALPKAVCNENTEVIYTPSHS